MVSLRFSHLKTLCILLLSITPVLNGVLAAPRAESQPSASGRSIRAPIGAVKLPKKRVFRLADVTCGNTKGRLWVAGRMIAEGYFYPFQAEKKNLAKELRKAFKGRRAAIVKRLEGLTGLLSRQGPLCSEGLAPERESMLSVGDQHACMLNKKGAVLCWGRNAFGQLGDGTTIDRSLPVLVSAVGSGNRAVFAGGAHTCVVTRFMGVKCFGFNRYGQLGDGSTTDRLTPVNVVGLESGVRKLIDEATDSTCAIMQSGTVKCWGSNQSGLLGDGTTINRSIPVDVLGLTSPATAISSGFDSSCILTTAGGVLCWGGNSEGQLGDGTTENRLTPVGVAGLSSEIAALTLAGFHVCAVTTSGAGKCWGENAWGLLGDGSLDQISPRPREVSGLSSGVKMITADSTFNCALMATGAVKCWGNLGGGSNAQRTPIDSAVFPPGTISLGVGREFTCALISKERVQCWGDNTHGQLGDGTTSSTWSPVEVRF